MSSTLILVNATDSHWTRNRYIFCFGAYGSTYLMVWANGIECALDVAVDWIAEHKPGILCNDEVKAEFDRYIGLGMSEEDAQEEATEDTTCAGNASDYIRSSEWGIVHENPTRAQILALQGHSL